MPTVLNAVLCSVASVVSDSFDPWAVAFQPPLSMGSSRKKYWTGLPYPPPGDLPNPGSNPRLLHLLHCRRVLYCEPPRKPSSSKCFLSILFSSRLWTVANKSLTVGLTLSSNLTENNEDPQSLSCPYYFPSVMLKELSSKQVLGQVGRVQAPPLLAWSWCPGGNWDITRKSHFCRALAIVSVGNFHTAKRWAV